MKILLVDNYDSFTYNLYHLLKKCSPYPVTVARNDEITVEEAEAYDKIVISPGPGIPEEAGLTLGLIQAYAGKKKILGVCLGHQAIAVAMGGKLVNMDKVHHASTSDVLLDEDPGRLFADLPRSFSVGRYHSWTVDEAHLPSCLRVTARDEEGGIMALEHREFAITGVQFHPESILTEHGENMVKNWLFS